MTPGKRLFDLVLALALLPLLLPVIILLAGLILVCDGAPVFYCGERMGHGGRPFLLVKFRTMGAHAETGAATGGHSQASITRLGHVLRRLRLDELPQIFHILHGRMSFVGPRPPLRRYVELYPELYAQVLISRPGVTGLATVRLHGQEARLLAPCRTAAETDAVYRRHCLPRKARLDRFYARRRSLVLDLKIILATAVSIFLRRVSKA
ncbi:sugar transferase [Defluviimonas sp. WL0075]|uniref:Sugar transferase n=1 Tax=Albidovulum sediminicola TaxID=2984331 RepID=A0ABT2Z2H8_9RHOB|nr:sugar transferase [Defluviimonas sp. WL0075]MCV2865293.1 sugar transferase [Defluviimonas sp. WL0075]